MKNLKLLKEYYKLLGSTGKAVFLLAIVIAAYVIIEIIS